MNSNQIRQEINKIVDNSNDAHINDCKITLDSYSPETTGSAIIKIVPKIKPVFIEVSIRELRGNPVILKELLTVGALKSKSESMKFAFRSVNFDPGFLTQNVNIPEGKMICNPETRNAIIDKCIEYPDYIPVSKMLFEGP